MARKAKAKANGRTEQLNGREPGRVGSAWRREGFIDPSEVVAERLRQRVKTLRTERNWSLEEFSKACGVSRSMLSQIERGEANPTLAVMFRIAQVFGMSLGELIDAPSATSGIEVIRADDQAHTYRSDPDCRIRTLSPLHLEKDVEFYELRLAAGGALVSAAHFEGTREFLTVWKGRLLVVSGEDRAELQAGDSAHYRADLPHRIENHGKIEAVAFLVVTYRD
jgi:transcriptional regulator with XRE-family HTH domain